MNEKRAVYLRSERTWKLGDDVITEKEQYKQLDDKYLNLDEIVADVCKKMKGTLLSIVNCGLHENGLDPITSKHIYNSVVLPKALNGCELWSDLLPKRAHRFCLKFMQFLPRNTKTEVALALLGCEPIEVEIDHRKLTFLSQLCNLPCHVTGLRIVYT